MAYFKQRKWLYLLALPAVLFFMMYIIIPFFISLYYSFTNYQGFGAAKWIGLKNYQNLWKSRLFWRSLKNTAETTLTVLVFLVPIAFVIALLLHSVKGLSNFYKTFLFAPVIISSVISGIAWVFILEPGSGLINTLLRKIGLGALTQQWIGGLVLTPYSVALVYIWQQAGYIATILLAALKQIPSELYEAARIDGANRMQIVFHLEIPMVRESFFIVYVLSLTGALKVFDTVRMLTDGGPNRMSESLLTFMYNTTYVDGVVCMGNAISVIIFLITFGFSLVMIRLYSAQQA